MSREPLNREERRHPEQLDERPAGEQAPPQEQEVFKGPQDVVSTRAKSSGHGKKTADKWNQ